MKLYKIKNRIYKYDYFSSDYDMIRFTQVYPKKLGAFYYSLERFYDVEEIKLKDLNTKEKLEILKNL